MRHSTDVKTPLWNKALIDQWTELSQTHSLPLDKGILQVWLIFSIILQYKKTCNIATIVIFGRVYNRDRTTKVLVAAHPNLTPNSFYGTHGNRCDKLFQAGDDLHVSVKSCLSP